MGKSTLAADMTTGMAVGETFAMNVATFSKDEKVEVDFGDGELKELLCLTHHKRKSVVRLRGAKH